MTATGCEIADVLAVEVAAAADVVETGACNTDG